MMLSYARRFWINENETSCFSFYDDDDKERVLFAHTQLDVTHQTLYQTFMNFFLLRNTKHMLGSKQHWTSLTVMSLTKRN